MPKSKTRITLGDPQSLNWRTHVLFAIPALLSAGFFDFDRLGGNPSLWLVLSIIGLAVTIGTIELLTLVLKKRAWKKPHLFVVLGILFAAGFARGLTLLVLGQAWGIVPETDVVYRLTGGPIFVISIYLMVDIMVSSFVQHREQTDTLLARQKQLELARADFENEITRLTEAQRGRVRELVAPSVWELQKFLGSKSKSVQDAIFEIRSLNETIVRPLSKQMSVSENTFDESNLTREIPEIKTTKTVIPKKVQVSDSLSSGFFLIVALVIGFSSQSVVMGVLSAIELLIVTLPVVMLGVWLVKFAFRNREINSYLALILVPGFGAVVGFVAGSLTSLLGLNATDQFAVQTALFVAVNMLFTLGLGVAGIERDKSLSDLQQAVSELALLNSRLRQRVWLARKTLAMELHGSIQSTLQSVAARLAKLENPSDDELERAMEQVRGAFDGVDSQDYLSGNSLGALLDELVTLWEGALDVQLTLTPQAEQALGRDTAAARCVLEVCREAVTNAAKHGDAEQVRITIEPGKGFVRIRALNDGILMTNENQGQGISLYREVAHEFSLENAEGGVLLDLVLPLNG